MLSPFRSSDLRRDTTSLILGWLVGMGVWVAVQKNWPGPDHYPDFVAGAPAIWGFCKVKDYWSVYLALIGWVFATALLWLATPVWHARTRPRLKDISELSLYLLGVSSFVTFEFLLFRKFDPYLYAYLLIPALFSLPEKSRFTSLQAASVLLCSFLSSSVLIFIFALLGGRQLLAGVSKEGYWGILVFLTAIQSLLLHQNPRLSRKILIYQQVLYPLLLVRFLIVIFRDPQHPQLQIPITLSAVALVVSLVALLLRSSLRQANRALATDLSESLSDLLPTSLILAAVWTSAPSFDFAIYDYDNFHLGEMITPFNQWYKNGLLPYYDYVSLQGVIGYFHGLVHHLLYSDASYNTNLGFTIIRASAWTLACWQVLVSLGKREALALVLLGAPLFDRFYIIPILAAFLLWGLARPNIPLLIFLFLFGMFWNAGCTVSVGLGIFFILLVQSFSGKSWIRNHVSLKSYQFWVPLVASLPLI